MRAYLRASNNPIKAYTLSAIRAYRLQVTQRIDVTGTRILLCAARCFYAHSEWSGRSEATFIDSSIEFIIGTCGHAFDTLAYTPSESRLYRGIAIYLPPGFVKAAIASHLT